MSSEKKMYCNKRIKDKIGEYVYLLRISTTSYVNIRYNVCYKFRKKRLYQYVLIYKFRLKY